MRIIKQTVKVLLFCFFVQGTVTAQKPEGVRQKQKQYTIEQALSDRAQLHTMAFSGLAFITGDFGSDCFFPPGKVADFFGFQYMRDNDKNEMGHNTDFLTRIANNVISILSSQQLGQLTELANQQTSLYDSFAQKRMVLIKAFRVAMMENKQLYKAEIIKFGSALYAIDAELSYNRALTFGKLANSLTADQKAKLGKLDFGNSSTWPILPENLDKKSMSHRAHVSVMTYASEFFSWYAGSETADVYFCPERHGTYFGGFYLKDYPAMGNPGYSISTALTGDKGKDFIETIAPEQATCLSNTVKAHIPLMNEIVKVRQAVSVEFRKALINQEPDKDKVFSLIKHYGELDAQLSYDYAVCFSDIYQHLTTNQKQKLYKLRNLNIYPKGTYLYSDPIDVPEKLDYGLLLKP